MLTKAHDRDIWRIPSTPGLKCVTPKQEQNDFLRTKVISIIVDFALFGLPIWVIHRKMFQSRQKVQVMLVFSVELFVVATDMAAFRKEAGSPLGELRANRIKSVVRVVLQHTLLFLEDP